MKVRNSQTRAGLRRGMSGVFASPVWCGRTARALAHILGAMRIGPALLVALALGGCVVKKSTHQKAVSELRAENERLTNEQAVSAEVFADAPAARPPRTVRRR